MTILQLPMLQYIRPIYVCVPVKLLTLIVIPKEANPPSRRTEKVCNHYARVFRSPA